MPRKITFTLPATDFADDADPGFAATMAIVSNAMQAIEANTPRWLNSDETNAEYAANLRSVADALTRAADLAETLPNDE